MATYSATMSRDNRYSITLTITETIPSDYISTNQTLVNYTLTATKSSGGGYYSNNKINPVVVKINDTTVFNDTITYNFSGGTPKTITLASGTSSRIAHNSDGTKTINVSGSFEDKANSLGSATASGTFALTTIPRYASCNQSLSSKTETSIVMNWSSDSTCDYVWYSTNNGSSWTAVGGVNAKSGSYTISGLTANTTYNIKTRVRRKDSQLTTDSSASAIATYNYPNCTSGTNFTIGNSVSLQFYNPLNRTFKIKMWSYTSQTFLTGEIEISGTSYTFTPNANTLYASIPYNKSSRYTIDSIYNGNTITKWDCGTYSVDEISNAPTFNDFDYEDTNSTTLALTGDNSVIVQGYSNVQATISTSDKAIAKNSAIMKQYRMVIGGQTSSIESTELYKCSSANTTLCILNERRYYKTTDDLAYVGYYFGGDYTGPILVGTTADSVKFTTDGQTFSGSTYTYEGQTYYVSSTSYFMDGNRTSTGGIAIKLSSSAISTQQAIETMIEKLLADSEDIVLPTINNATSNVINMYAEDSRGISKLVSKTATFKDYTNITKDQISIERQNHVGEAVNLTFNGTYWNDNFGSITNSIIEVKYRYKKTTDSDWPSTWNGRTTIVPTVSDNTYSFSGGILGDTNTGFNINSSYNIEIQVSDALSSTTFSVILGNGTPNMAISEGGVAIKQPYDTNDDSVLQVNGKVEATGLGATLLNLVKTIPSSCETIFYTNEYVNKRIYKFNGFQIISWNLNANGVSTDSDGHYTFTPGDWDSPFSSQPTVVYSVIKNNGSNWTHFPMDAYGITTISAGSYRVSRKSTGVISGFNAYINIIAIGPTNN